MEDLPHTTTTPHPGSAYLVPEKLSPVCQVLWALPTDPSYFTDEGSWGSDVKPFVPGHTA